MVGCTEAAYGTEALAERAYGVVDVGADTHLGCQTLSTVAKNTKRMGFIDKEIDVMPFFDVDKFVERRSVAKHAVNAFDHNTFVRLVVF